MAVPDATRHARPRPWHHHPPAPSAAPGLYTSVVLRRSVAYLVDVVIIAVLGLALGFVLSLIGLLSFGLLSPLAVLVMALWPLPTTASSSPRAERPPGWRCSASSCESGKVARSSRSEEHTYELQSLL